MPPAAPTIPSSTDVLTSDPSEAAAARYLGVHPGTLQRWRTAGEAPKHFIKRNVGRNCVRYDRYALARFKRTQTGSL